jgi:hypothetical protein
MFHWTTYQSAFVFLEASLGGLNEVEARELLTLDRGESVLLLGPNHIPLYTVIPPDWYPLWTTDPRDKR